VSSTTCHNIRVRFYRSVCSIVGILLLTAHLPADANSLIWQSGFERGFPGGEWLDFDSGSYSASGAIPANRMSAWTIINRASGEPVFSGNHAYKGWISGPSGSTHRAYPVVHLNIATPVINTFMVYLDVDYERMSDSDWIHLGTWGNFDPDTKAGKWALHTMSIRNRKLEFAHVEPFTGKYIGAGKRTDFPLRQWVRLTIYMHYEGDTGTVKVWQDGKPMLQARVSQLEAHPGTHLRTAHWGMYGSGTLDHGTQYNDNIRICKLTTPVAKLLREPSCQQKPGND
jgi:hypothetical protein